MDIRYIDWGDDSAEQYSNLIEYFVDSPAYNLLYRKRKRIVLGRKGSGKSAIRKKLISDFEDSICIEITPNENIIKSIVNEPAVDSLRNSEIAFQYVWLAYIYDKIFIELAKQYRGTVVSGNKEFIVSYAEESNRYNKDLGGIVTNLLEAVKIKAGKMGEIGIGFERKVIGVTNIEQMEFHLSDVLSDNIHIFIDDLDLGWDNSDNSNNLLLGLLNAMNHLKNFSTLIIPFVFIRTDMYKILMSKTQHSDKFRDVSYIKWDNTSLQELLIKRILYNYDIENEKVPENPLTVVFPQYVGNSLSLNWIFERTLGRPRELIQLCKKYTEGLIENKADSISLVENEKIYSDWKLEDVCNEFSNKYPKLQSFFDCWKRVNHRVKYHLKSEEFIGAAKKIFEEEIIKEDWYLQSRDNPQLLFSILYEIGIIGDFIGGGDGGSKTIYISYDDTHSPVFKEVQIHPCFRKSLGTVTRIRNKAVRT